MVSVSSHFFCDGGHDCGDWWDEFNCTRWLYRGMLLILRKSVCSSFLKVTSDVGDSTPCPAASFHCKGHMCIPQTWVCDGSEDCLDGLDERHCTAAGVRKLEDIF